jgi:hypothetical protein
MPKLSIAHVIRPMCVALMIVPHNVLSVLHTLLQRAAGIWGMPEYEGILTNSATAVQGSCHAFALADRPSCHHEAQNFVAMP